MNRKLIIGEDSVYEIDEDCMRKKDRSDLHRDSNCADRKDSGRKDSYKKERGRKDSGEKGGSWEERDRMGRTGKRL